MSHVTSLTLKKKISLEEWDTHLCLLSKTNSRAILWQPSDQNSVLTAKGAGLILGRGTKTPELHGSTETKKKAKKKKTKNQNKPPKSPKIQITMALREAARMNPSNRQVCFRRIHWGNSLVVRWLWVHAFTAEGPGFISSYRTKIPWAKAKKKKNPVRSWHVNKSLSKTVSLQMGSRCTGLMCP